MERPQGCDDAALRERLARLEERHEAEKRIAHLNHESLQWQIDHLRHELRTPTLISTPLGLAAWTKLGLAVLLPFLVYLLTGSAEKASHASQLLGGP